MRHTLFCAGILLVGLAIYAEIRGRSDAHAAGAASTSAVSQSFDFGERWVGDSVLHTFRFRNPFSETLAITGSRTSCSCTLVENIPKTIESDGALELPVRMSLSREGHRMSATVLLEIDKIGAVTFELIGDVLRQAPSAIDVGTLRPGAKVESQFHVRSRGAMESKILSLNPSDHRLKATVAESTKAGTTVAIEVTGGPESGRFEHELKLRTTDAGSAELFVKILGEVVTELEVSPALVNFGVVAPADRLSKTITLSSYTGKPIRIVSLTASPESFVAARVIDGSSDDPSLEVSLDGRFPKTVFEGRLEITAHVGGTEIKRLVPLYAMRK